MPFSLAILFGFVLVFCTLFVIAFQDWPRRPGYIFMMGSIFLALTIFAYLTWAWQMSDLKKAKHITTYDVYQIGEAFCYQKDGKIKKTSACKKIKTYRVISWGILFEYEEKVK